MNYINVNFLYEEVKIQKLIFTHFFIKSTIYKIKKKNDIRVTHFQKSNKAKILQ